MPTKNKHSQHLSLLQAVCTYQTEQEWPVLIVGPWLSRRKKSIAVDKARDCRSCSEVISEGGLFVFSGRPRELVGSLSPRFRPRNGPAAQVWCEWPVWGQARRKKKRTASRDNAASGRIRYQNSKFFLPFLSAEFSCFIILPLRENCEKEQKSKDEEEEEFLGGRRPPMGTKRGLSPPLLPFPWDTNPSELSELPLIKYIRIVRRNRSSFLFTVPQIEREKKRRHIGRFHFENGNVFIRASHFERGSGGGEGRAENWIWKQETWREGDARKQFSWRKWGNEGRARTRSEIAHGGPIRRGPAASLVVVDGSAKKPTTPRRVVSKMGKWRMRRRDNTKAQKGEGQMGKFAFSCPSVPSQSPRAGMAFFC